MTHSQDPPRRSLAFLVLLLAAALLAGFIAWRRHANPTARWANTVELNHTDQINRAITRCFGGHTEATVRAVIVRTRAGALPPPFRECRSGPAAELIVAPNGFMETLRNAPEQVTGLSNRARSDLLRLSSSARQLEIALSAGGSSPTDAQREAIAQSLDSVAHDIGAEQRSIADLVASAREAAGWI